MSGLVDYDSSTSDDGGGEAESPTSTTKMVPPTTATPLARDDPIFSCANAPPTSEHGSVGRIGFEEDPIGPVLGPAGPVNGEISQPFSFHRAAEMLPERDAIRYQTQTPVPMTSMPSSPSGPPNQTANARFAQFAELKAKGVHFNEDLWKRSSFLKPGLTASMMSRAGVIEDQQYDVALPVNLWDPRGFPPQAYEEELFKSQQAIRAKHESERKSSAGKRLIHFSSIEERSGE